MKKYVVENECPARHVKRFEFDTKETAVAFANKRQKTCKSAINVWEKIESGETYDTFMKVYNTQGYIFESTYQIGH